MMRGNKALNVCEKKKSENEKESKFRAKQMDKQTQRKYNNREWVRHSVTKGNGTLRNRC